MEVKDETAFINGHDILSYRNSCRTLYYLEVSGFSVSDFVEGILTGVSLVMNLYYLVRKSRKHRA